MLSTNPDPTLIREPTERHAPLVAYEQLQRAHEQLRTMHAAQSVQLGEASTQIAVLRAKRDQLLAQNEGLRTMHAAQSVQLEEASTQTQKNCYQAHQVPES